METALSFVDGAWLREGKADILYNPANLDEQVGEVWLADPTLAGRAVEAADAAWPAWRNTDFQARHDLLSRTLDEVEQRSDLIARTLTAENGKTLKEAYGEVNGSLKDGRYLLQVAAEDHQPISGQTTETWHVPLGVFAHITPWNFPLATLVRKMVPALVLGNTVVVKPSEVTPLTPAIWFQCLEAAGLPQGVANMVQGRGSVVGPPIISHPKVSGVSFTGSTRTGLLINDEVQRRRGRVQLEMGGKNALVVLHDADLDAAADAAVHAAFSCAGQWCTSTSRIVAEKAILSALLEKIVDRTKNIKIGDGRNPITTMGPVASAMQHNKASRAIETALSEGANLIHGGSLPETIDGARGYWVEPTIFSDVDPSSDLAQQEVFGPIIGLMPARNADEALALTNGTDYGLAFAIFTEDDAVAERFMTEVEAGMCHINLPTSFRDPSMPLTGWKASGQGVPECGRFAQEFYTHPKAIYRKRQA